MARLLTADEVTAMLGVSRRTFETMIAKNKAPPHIKIGRLRRWRHPDVEAWVDALAERSAVDQSLVHL